MVKKLDFTVYCTVCKVECIETENGILCPKCGAFISLEELEETWEFGEKHSR